MSETNTISPLRQRMIEDMAARKLNPHTQRGQIYSCKRLAAWLRRSPNTPTPQFQSRRALVPASVPMRFRRTRCAPVRPCSVKRGPLLRSILHTADTERAKYSIFTTITHSTAVSALSFSRRR
jgi:hypothetical protein